MALYDKVINPGIHMQTKLFSVPVIDSRAATSILSDKVYQTLPEEVRPAIRL